MFYYQLTCHQQGTLTCLHQHTSCQLIYMRQGCGLLVTENQSYMVSNGDIVWVPATVKHDFKALKDSGAGTFYFDTQYSIHADVTFLLPTNLALHLLEDFDNIWKREDSALIVAYSQVIFDQVTQLKPMLSFYNRAIETEDNRLVLALSQLYSRPAITTSLGEVASQCGASERTLNRLFQDTFGCSFRFYRQQVVMGKALQLTRLGHRMTEIAIELGYGSLSAFSTAFQRFLAEHQLKNA